MRGEGRSETARRFLFSILVISTVVVLLFTLLAFLFAPSLVHFLAPGMKGETFLQALRLSKVLLPFLLLISLALWPGPFCSSPVGVSFTGWPRESPTGRSSSTFFSSRGVRGSSPWR